MTSFRVVRLDPHGGVTSVIATFATREAAEKTARALTRALTDETYAVQRVDVGPLPDPP